MMKRERKLLTEKGLLKLIEKIKNGEDLESQYRVFRGYNITRGLSISVALFLGYKKILI